MALGDIIQQGTRFGSGGTTTFSPTLTGAATLGNLLVCYVSVTTAGRTVTTPAGWTAGPANSAGTAMSSALFWKESDGTETGVTLTLSGSGGGYANIMEFDATGADLSALDASASDATNVSTAVTSQTSGTAVGTATNGLALAFFSVDIGGNVDAGRAYTNSFIESDTSDTANTSRGGYYLARKVITANSNETTFSTTETAEEMHGSIIVFSATATYSLSGEPATINANGSHSITVNDPAVTPTTGNTEVKFTDDLGVAATVTSVTGTGPYTVNFSFPDTTAIQFDGTGYPLYVEVAAENATTAAIPYQPATGYAFTNLVNPLTTEGSILEGYTGDAPVTGDQVVYTTPSSPDNIVFTVGSNGEWVFNSMPPQNQTVQRYVIQANGTVGTEATVTYTVTGGGGDTEAPVITVTGSTSIQLALGEAYVELGATWTDNVDGSGAATVGGDTVDVNTIGTYVVTYNYTDVAGNPATQKTRTVQVGGAVSTLLVSDFPATTVNSANDIGDELVALHDLTRRAAADVARQIENYIDALYDTLRTDLVVGTAPDATVPATVNLKALYNDFVQFTRVERIKINRAKVYGADSTKQALADQLKFWLEQQGWTFAQE